MAIVLSGTTNDITVNGVSVATDADVSSAVAPKANMADVNTQLGLKANLDSPEFTGAPLAPTATVGTNTTQIATTAFVLANASAVNATTVGNATAGIGAGLVGSYAFAVGASGTDVGFGGIVAGSRISAYGCTDINARTGGTLTGTWKCLGMSSGTNFTIASVYLRIA